MCIRDRFIGVGGVGVAESDQVAIGCCIRGGHHSAACAEADDAEACSSDGFGKAAKTHELSLHFRLYCRRYYTFDSILLHIYTNVTEVNGVKAPAGALT